MKKISTFWKIYFVYVLVLIAAIAAVFVYVRGVMVEYENSSADNYIASELKEAAEGKGKIYAYLQENCFAGKFAGIGDASARSAAFKENAASENIEINLNPYSYDSAKPIYDVSADGNVFLTICTSEGETRTKLGILTMSDWNVDYAILRNESNIKFKPPEDGKLSYTVNIPEGFTIEIDGKEYQGQPDSGYDISSFVYIEPYVQVPKMQVYEFSDLAFEPEFSVINNAGNVVELTQKDNVYTAELKYGETEDAKSVITAELDPLEIAQLWSKFMTADVDGYYHGFETVVEGCRLLEGTSLYRQARSWSRSIDITFVSVHTLEGFSNSNVSNYIKYSPLLYSCDVYTEKNLHLKNGADRVDIFNNRMYFAKIDGEWYLIDMLSIER